MKSTEKIRPRSHLIGEKAVRILKDEILSAEWVVRELTPDYGIDLDIELFEYEEGRCVTLGEHVFAQVKGTENAVYKPVVLNGKKIDVIQYRIEVCELNLIERMGSALPVLLIVVDTDKKKAFQICLNDYIRKCLPEYNPDYKNKKTVTIYVPVANEILRHDIFPIKWYGARTKIYSMFHEMLVDIEDTTYMDLERKIMFVQHFLQHYRDYDVLKYTNLWPALNDIKDKIISMAENDCILPEGLEFVSHVVENAPLEKWREIELFNGLVEEGTDAYKCAQDFSINRLFELITVTSGMFETCCRQWFMPGLMLGIEE